MKKLLRCAALALVMALLMAACSSAPSLGAKDLTELTDKFLKALAAKDYEAVVNLLPKEVAEYGEKYLEGTREDVVAFAKYAAHDYYWLAEMNLPAHPDYTYEITEMGSEIPEKAKGGGSVLMEEDGVVLYVQAMGGVALTVDIGEEEPVEGSLFALQLDDGRWYLISVAGDDEIFIY